jgi:UDP-N-acetyl-2-amino-2-deoxyglucuronate dehydrogenase
VTPLSVLVVGLRGIGMAHARGFAACGEFVLAAGCDLDPAAREAFAAAFPGVRVHADFAEALAVERPEVVVVATSTSSHAALATRAAEAGVRGVYCEKPMAVSLGDARRMLDACRAAGAALAVNHQRRTTPPYLEMRRLIAAGAIGTLREIRIGCAGDVLSDGTHAVDSARFLAGDPPAWRVTGTIERPAPDPAAPRGAGFEVSGGWRYGHPVEAGAEATIEFAGSVVATLRTGVRQPRGRAYQDVEAIGDGGRLWRAGDQADPPLRIAGAGSDDWRPVEVPGDPETAAARSAAPLWVYRRFAETIRVGAPHPLAGESGFRDQEIVMAIYESARRGAPVTLPLDEDRFPLAVMLEEGRERI